jgi:hypothetical protein
MFCRLHSSSCNIQSNLVVPQIRSRSRSLLLFLPRAKSNESKLSPAMIYGVPGLRHKEPIVYNFLGLELHSYYWMKPYVVAALSSQIGNESSSG